MYSAPSISAFIAFLTLSGVAKADDAPQSPGFKPPAIKLQSAGPVTLGEAEFVSLTLEVSNPNDFPLTYTGYWPDSFGPPLAKGIMAPLTQIEMQREGQWQTYPQGFCGFGIDQLELKPKSKSTFSVSVPDDGWQMVKVGFGHYPGWSEEEEETKTITLWSVVLTREEIEKRQKPAALEKPAESSD